MLQVPKGILQNLIASSLKFCANEKKHCLTKWSVISCSKYKGQLKVPDLEAESISLLCKCFFKFLTRDSFGDNFLVTNMWEVRFISKFYGNLDILFLGRFNESE